MNLADSIAIVTGSSSGIGQSFAEQLLQKGATVYGLSRSFKRMEVHKSNWVMWERITFLCKWIYQIMMRLNTG